MPCHNIPTNEGPKVYGYCWYLDENGNKTVMELGEGLTWFLLGVALVVAAAVRFASCLYEFVSNVIDLKI